MSYFILHNQWKGKKHTGLLAVIASLLVAAAGCYVVHSMGTARANSRETIVLHSGEELEQYLLDQESEEYNLNGKYRLEADLDLSWLYQSIGTNLEPFTGDFDGNGYVISGLTRPLFGVLKEARIENLFLSGASIHTPVTYYDGERYVDGYGALAAYAVDSDIDNCGMGGEIQMEIPVETGYLLAKASPADAEEEKGPGIESGLSSGRGPDLGGNEGSAESFETEEHSSGGIEVETEPGQMESTGVKAESKAPEESEAPAESKAPEESGAPVESEIPAESEVSAESEALAESKNGKESSAISVNPVEQTVVILHTGIADTGIPDKDAETAAVRMVERQYHMMKLSEVIDPDVVQEMEATPSDAIPEIATPPNAQTQPDTPDAGKPETATSAIAQPGYVMGDRDDVFIMVTASRITAGGLIAQMAGNTTVSECFTCTTIMSRQGVEESFLGGLAGIAGQKVRIENSYSSGFLDGNDTVGGFVAVNDGMAENCFSSSILAANGNLRGAFAAKGEGRLAGCIYDRQMACADDTTGGENSTESDGEERVEATASDAEAATFRLEGRNTAEMSGSEARMPGKWYRTEHAYPQIEYFAVSTNQAAAEYSKISAVALLLPEETNLQTPLLEETSITLPEEVDGQAIVWSTAGEIHMNGSRQVMKGSKTEESPETAGYLRISAYDIQEIPGPVEPLADTSSVKGELAARIGAAAKTYPLNMTAAADASVIYRDWRSVGEAVYNNTNDMGIYKPKRGDGSPENPFEIDSPEALAWFSYAVYTDYSRRSWCLRMTKDLDLNGEMYNDGAGKLLWNGLTSQHSNNSFGLNGVIDGGGYSVSNLYGDTGFICDVGFDGTVKDFGVASGEIISNDSHAGGVAQQVAYSGFTGRATNARFERCYNHASITSIGSGNYLYTAGIVGLARDGTQIIDCYNTGTITGRASGAYAAGGIAAYHVKTIKNCYNTGNVSIDKSSTNNRADGLFGYVSGGGTTNSYALQGVAPTTRGGVQTEDVMRSWAFAYKLNEQKMEGAWQYNPEGYPLFSKTKKLVKAPDWEAVGQGMVLGWLPDTKPAGNGSAEDPYQITNAAQFGWFAYQVNSGTKQDACAKLMNHINLGEAAYGGSESDPILWKPVGTSTAPYTGTFDGNGNMIHNMRVEQDGAAGLFGYAGGGAVIEKLGLAPSCSVKHKSAADGTTEAGTAGFVGLVVRAGTSTANAAITIQNCYNRAVVEGGDGSKTGAFVGTCVVDGSVQKITNCYNTGLIKSAAGEPGAIAGSFAAYRSGAETGIQSCIWDSQTSVETGTLQAVSGGGTAAVLTESMVTQEMKSNAAVTRLNTVSGGALKTGTDRVWYTSLEAEETGGYPTLVPPVTTDVTFSPETLQDGNTQPLKTGAVTDLKLRALEAVDSYFTPGSTGENFFAVPCTDITGMADGYHKYGYINANQNLGIKAGSTDLKGTTVSDSLNDPTLELGTVENITLFRAAAYTKAEPRYILLEASSGTTRYEIRITVPGITGKTISVTMPVKVTMADLTPDGTDHADFSSNLSITNRNPYPVDGKILRASAKDTDGYVKLTPAPSDIPLSHTGNLTDPEGGVKLGLADWSGANPAVVGAIKYYNEDAPAGTAWMEYRIKYGGSLSYRYVMEYSGLHLGPESQFEYQIGYWFSVSAQDYDQAVDAVVTP